jgi:hypothetical protein
VPLNQRFQTVLVTLTKRPYGFEVCHLYVLHARGRSQVSDKDLPPPCGEGRGGGVLERAPTSGPDHVSLDARTSETLGPLWPFKEP